MIPTPYYTYNTAVTYDDLGPDGLLSRRSALRVLQEAATLASHSRGYGPEESRRRGGCWILSAWRLELNERPQWNAPITVRTWPRTMDGFTSDRDFRLFTGDHEIGRATSHWVLVDPATGKLKRITEDVAELYALSPESVFSAPLPKNGRSPEEAEETYALTVGRRDIDTNHHVNNLHYLDYAVEALPQAVYEALPSTVEIVFKRQILLGDRVRCLYARLPDGKHQVEISTEADGKTVHNAFVWFY